MNLSGQLNIVVGVNKDRCCADKFVSDQMNRAHRDLLHLLGRCEYERPRRRTSATLLGNQLVTYTLKINCVCDSDRWDSFLFLVIYLYNRY